MPYSLLLFEWVLGHLVVLMTVELDPNEIVQHLLLSIEDGGSQPVGVTLLGVAYQIFTL